MCEAKRLTVAPNGFLSVFPGVLTSLLEVLLLRRNTKGDRGKDGEWQTG